MAATEGSLSILLSTLTSSLESAVSVLPEDAALLPPREGISLLDVKNELLLSYLQNLVFLIVLKLRSLAGATMKENEDERNHLQHEVVKKLVELRVYLEKGVRPLENRLKYQIDKVIRAAEDAARATSQKSGGRKPAARGAKQHLPRSGSASQATDAESGGTDSTSEEIDELSYRPNPSAFLRPKSSANKSSETATKDGIYRPPRITPTALPTTQGREEREARRPGRSATMDEFIATELSNAPVAEPSIGSTIVSGGRRMKSQREREEEVEKREYEETNFVRLPKLSKKDKAKQGNRARDGTWGGEEWRGLGAGLDRIESLTQKKGRSSLEKSRKRPIEDGPRGTGAAFGDVFEKRRKISSKRR